MLSTFIKLPIVIKIFVLSIFERLFNKGFTVLINMTFEVEGHPSRHVNLRSIRDHTIVSETGLTFTDTVFIIST